MLIRFLGSGIVLRYPGIKKTRNEKSQDFENGENPGPKKPRTKIFKKLRDQKISKIPSLAHP